MRLFSAKRNLMEKGVAVLLLRQFVIRKYAIIIPLYFFIFFRYDSIMNEVGAIFAYNGLQPPEVLLRSQ
jgi:hypothetical protein